MKNGGNHILWALCLALFVVCPQKARAEIALKESSDAFARTRIKAGLDKVGVGEGYTIVVADERDLVENTAAEEMQRLLAKVSLSAGIVPESKATGAKRILLGRESNLRAIRNLGDKGEVNIRDVSAEDDGFHLKRIGDDIVIAGANPRGVLYGVYAFEDFINDGATGRLDVRKVPWFRKRASAPGYYWSNYVNFASEDFPEEKARYLARLGINQVSPDEGGMDFGRLTSLVRSDVFPFQTPPQPETQRKVKLIAAICKKYGIDYYLMLWEPLLPRLSGDLSKYPEEALGMVRRPWGGTGPDGVDRTLCIYSPIVQKHYRSMMRRFVREYPDIKGVQFYNMDGNSWLCTPELCERCRTACKDSPPDQFNPWESQAKLVTLLADAAHAENPDFDFRFWATTHYPAGHFDKMIRAAQGYNSLLSSWTGSDRTIILPDAAIPSPTFISAQNVCKERMIPFYTMHEFNNLEQIPKSLPFPLHVCDALKKYKNQGAIYIHENAGPDPGHNPINALVMKAFQWNPDQDTKKFLADLSVRQFGEASGGLMYRAWEEMEKALNAWNDIQSAPFPLNGSSFPISFGKTLGGLPPPITPEVVDYYDSTIAILTRVEPWLAFGYQKYKSPEYLGKLELMDAHLVLAAEHAKQAIAAASDKKYIDIDYYEGPNGRPTQKEYAELNHAPIAIAETMCRQRSHLLRAYLLLTGIERARTLGDEKSARAKENQYLDLVREDIGTQERFRELLEGFAKMQPCYTRTSMTDQEISDLLSATGDKIGRLKACLATKGG